ncbi:sensor histidine kinase [Nocardioides sp.]|uniref:sensor histidine kinase n=1 Tax=Nocardioides sp. TaxID=35761 RepID=UPI002B26E4FC|nr:ATP-binding protein [Nocardioides sp.]
MTDPRDSRGTALEREFRETQARLQSLLEHHPHGFFSLDRDGLFTALNPAALILSGGYTEDELRATGFEALLAPEDRKRMAEHFAAMLEGHSKRLDVRFRRKDGSWGELDLIGVPILVDGEVIGVHATIEDITERVRMQQVLDEAVRAAESATLAKSLFLATMSHEIRTPLTSVLAALELMTDTDLSPQQSTLWSIMNRSGERLLSLVDEILDFSRIESGKSELALDTFYVNELVEWTGTVMGPAVREKGLAFEATCTEDLKGPVIGDAERIHQVLANLVGNAAKFTAEGMVALRVSSFACDAESVGVRFDVVDTGVGLTGEQQRLVFESFRQADSTITRKYGGTGLGLAISRQLVSLMGGTIEVASMPGRGSTFTVLLSLPRRLLTE